MGPVDQQKRELCKQAYLLIHKYLAVTGKEGQETFDFRKNLRKKDALDIDLATNKEVISEVNKFKEAGGAVLLTAGGGAAGASALYGGASGTSGVKASKSRGGGTAGGTTGGTAATGLPPVGASGGSRSTAKPSKSAAKGGGAGGKADGPSSPSSLPYRVGEQVNRWWPNEQKWYTAVITDYNTDTNCYRLTYNLCSNTETYEDFNLDVADPAVYAFTGEKLNLLTKTGSAAVNNSTVLRPYLARAGVGGASGGGGGGGAGGGSGGGGSSTKPSAKKRRSEDDDDDSDSDYS